jgi:hypothetical protein
MELKSSAKKIWHLPHAIAPSFVAIEQKRGSFYHVSRRDMEKFQEISRYKILVHTWLASFEMKLEVWISTLAPSSA